MHLQPSPTQPFDTAVIPSTPATHRTHYTNTHWAIAAVLSDRRSQDKTGLVRPAPQLPHGALARSITQ